MNLTPTPTSTQTHTQKVKYWLERAMEAASGHGLGVIGFVVQVSPVGVLEFEPFASSSTLEPEQFVELVALASRQMIGTEEGESIN